MQLTEDSTKLKLFMDVLDGTKAAVSFHGTNYVLVINVFSLLLPVLLYFSPLLSDIVTTFLIIVS